jgi:hypothetical protein
MSGCYDNSWFSSRTRPTLPGASVAPIRARDSGATIVLKCKVSMAKELAIPLSWRVFVLCGVEEGFH